MRVTASSEPGSPHAPNEDAYFISPDRATVAIFDGATARTGTGCTHGVAWYTHSLAGALASHTRLTPAKGLAAAITDTAARHRNTCDLAHPGTPSAAVGIVQARRTTLRYLLLGDVTLVLDLGHGIRVLTDNRVHATARAERQAADELPSGSPEKAQALVRMKQAELTARNVAGGYWLAAADPAIVTHAITGDLPRQHVQQAALLSDGAARAVDPFQLCDWQDLLTVLARDGPGELIRQVRAAETADPAGIRWPATRSTTTPQRYSSSTEPHRLAKRSIPWSEDFPPVRANDICPPDGRPSGPGNRQQHHLWARRPAGDHSVPPAAKPPARRPVRREQPHRFFAGQEFRIPDSQRAGGRRKRIQDPSTPSRSRGCWKSLPVDGAARRPGPTRPWSRPCT